MDSRALWRVLVDSLARRPDSELIDRDDWVQLRTPSSPYHTHNKVLLARLHPADADRRIAEVKADHDQRGAGITWIVDPQSAPNDLSARLDAHGIAFDAMAIGMTRAVPQEAPPPLPKGISIRPATVDDVDTIAMLSHHGFGGPPSFTRFVAEWVRECYAGNLGNMTHWLAFEGDTAVGQCTLRVLPGLGYLQGGVVFESSARSRDLSGDDLGATGRPAAARDPARCHLGR